MAARAPRSGLTKGTTPVALGQVQLETPVVLAPMAGVTDHAFRRLCRQHAEAGLPHAPKGEWLTADSGLFVSEMVTARALLEDNRRSWFMVQPEGGEPVRSIQLYGTDPDSLGRAAAVLVERGYADHIDLNFGCPAPKVTRKGGGAAIPWKKDLFADMVRSTVTSVDQVTRNPGQVPVTVKMRLGTDADHMTAVEAGQTAERLGAAAVGLHARTHAQYYSGAADWTWIARLKEALDIPVLGNGDVFSAEDAMRMVEQTGCDGVIVGRGCQGRPWLFEEISAAFWGQPTPQPPNLGAVADILLEHAALAVKVGDEERAMKSLRKHIGWYLRGFPVGGETKRSLQSVSTYKELETKLSALDRNEPFPEVADGPRGRAGKPRKPHLPAGWLDSRYLNDHERAGLVDAEHDISGG